MAGSIGGGKCRLKVSLEVTSKAMSDLQSLTEGGKAFQILGLKETQKARFTCDERHLP